MRFYRRRHVESLKGGRWRSTTSDAQFEYWIVPGLRYTIFETRSETLLRPALYLDFGAGFENGEEVVLRETTAGLYIVDIGSFPHIRRLRFDPSSRQGDVFSISAFAGVRTAATRAAAAKKLRLAIHERPQTPGGGLVCETIVGPRPSRLAGVGVAPAKIRTAKDYLDLVTMLAHQHFRARPGEGSLYSGAAAPNGLPQISFVAPVYDTPPDYLDDLLNSLRMQTGAVWELLLCDDGSTRAETLAWLAANESAPGVRVLRNGRNEGIASASNLGVAAARGDWVAFIDHDDALAPYALECVMEALRANPQALFLYTDEIVADGRLTPQSCFLKPAFDPVLLSGMNYINHLSLYRRERLLEIGALAPGRDGSQDYDLLLRYLRGLSPSQALHLPYPAYIWRRDGNSYSTAFLDKATRNARAALGEAYADADGPAPVGPALNPDHHRILFRAPAAWPKVSVVIPSRDAWELISRLLTDLLEKTDYPDLEIWVVDNGSTDPRVLRLYETMRERHPAFHALVQAEPFNFSRQANRGFARATGEAILLLNNDIEVLTPDWLKEMVACLRFPDTGIVGARLLYPDGALQHAGVIAGLGSVAGHWYCRSPVSEPGPMGRLNVRQSFSAVTGACQLISRACLQAVGPYNETDFAIAYNDIDFCLRAGRLGFRCVWTPFATLRHHESASRGSDETRENRARFSAEQQALRSAYDLVAFDDPAYSPWWSRDGATPGLIAPARLPQARSWPPRA